MNNLTRTNGNVIVDNLDKGDTIFEYAYGSVIESVVLDKPVFNPRHMCWRWKSKEVTTGKIIDYLVSKGNEHYSATLYTYNPKKIIQ